MVLLAGDSQAADLRFETLQSGTTVYSNVTVYGQSETDLYISYAGGMGNVKISSLDHATLRALGLKGGADETVSERIGSSKTMEQVKASMASINSKYLEQFGIGERLKNFKPSPQILAGAVAVGLLCYLFFCFCFKLICLNAGEKPGGLIWLPILQLLPLLRAARMPGWHLLLFFVPVVNIGMSIWWTFRIVKACGKTPLVAVLMILPITNLFAFLYLAFSKGRANTEDTKNPGPVKLDGWTAAQSPS